MTEQTDTLKAEEIARLQKDADRLEDRAERDGVLPGPEENGDGVGPLTGVVP